MVKESIYSEKSKILRQTQLRLFILMYIPVFLIWGLALNYLRPEVYDPFWIRATLASLTFIGIACSYFIYKPIDYLSWLLVISAYVLTGHSYFLLAVNQFLGFSGTIMIIGLVMLALPSKKSSIIYLLLNLLVCVSLILFYAVEKNLEILFFFICMGVLLPSYLFKHYSLKSIELLKKGEEEKRQILQFMSDGLILMNKSGEIISLNPAAARILNLDENQKYFIDTRNDYWRFLNYKGDYISQEETPGSYTLKTGIGCSNISLGLENIRSGQICWLNVSTTPIFDNQNKKEIKSVLVSFADITDLKKAQDQATESQMHMAVASKLNSLGEMASGIAHEINNPLAIIHSKIYLISKMIKNNSHLKPAEDHFNKIDEMVLRIQKIVRGLRTFARQADWDPFETVPMKSIIDDTLGLCRQKLEKSNIVVTVDLEHELKFDCRPGQISQVLMNLLQNAADAVTNTDSKRIDIRSYREHDKIFLTVTDSGMGIPPHIKGKIMQPFFTTKEVGKGTGLGLSISVGIARQHEGNLYLDSSSQKTRFVLELPVEQNKNIDDFQVA